MSAVVPVERQDRQFMVLSAVLSALALAFLAWLLLIREVGSTGTDLSFMPALNAGLNGLSACLLVSGWLAIRARRIQLHRALMVSAFAASALFLLGYVAYHYVHGDTHFVGEGAIRVVYFAILISHVLLSMAVVPFALLGFYFAYRQRFQTHARLMRVGLPVWLYVSVTGVVIYFMLYGA